MLGLIPSPIPFTVLVFEFDPNEYMVREDDGAVDLSVSLAGGDLGEFTIVLTAATDDNNINANATGKYIMKFYSTVGPHRLYIPGSSDNSYENTAHCWNQNCLICIVCEVLLYCCLSVVV